MCLEPECVAATNVVLTQTCKHFYSVHWRWVKELPLGLALTSYATNKYGVIKARKSSLEKRIVDRIENPRYVKFALFQHNRITTEWL